MTNFQVGQKVVCIKRGRWSGVEVCSPKYGDILTIRAITKSCREAEPGLMFEEIKNPEMVFGCGCLCEPDFSVWRFRPITKKKTDISIFTAMLTTKQREQVL